MTTRNRRQSGAMERRNRAGGLLGMAGGALGAGAGALAMYLFDPRSGRRRRALVRDKFRRSLNEAETLSGKAMRDARHRAKGALAEGRAVFKSGQVDDSVLHERVRAQLGRSCSHPRAIEVVCQDGEVELRGPVLANEHHTLLSNIKRVRGVKEVHDLLAVHAEPDIPALQGGPPKGGPQREILQQSWTPAMRLLGVVLGAGLFGYGVFRRQVVGRALGLFGAGLAARALSNRPAGALVGTEPLGIEIQKTIHIDAPVKDVYGFFARPENLPRFMTHVDDVHRVEDGAYHWVVEGPAGRRFSWDASFDAVANESVSWRSSEGSTIDNEGSVHFSEEDGRTKVDIQMVYHPPAGALGHAFARALGADPKRAMDDDLLRLKSLLEDGAVTGRFGQLRRDQLEREASMSSPLFGRAGARPPVEKQ